MHGTARLDTSEDAESVYLQNYLTGGAEVDLFGARVVGLLKVVESAQNQPILI